jgi:hypothetical protein
MHGLFAFCLDLLAGALAGARTLTHTRQLLAAWPNLFPSLDPKEAQLSPSEFAVYLTAVARQSRSKFGTAWDDDASLSSVRDDFLSRSTAVEVPMTAARMLRRTAAPAARAGKRVGAGSRAGAAAKRTRPAARRRRPR